MPGIGGCSLACAIQVSFRSVMLAPERLKGLRHILRFLCLQRSFARFPFRRFLLGLVLEGRFNHQLPAGEMFLHGSFHKIKDQRAVREPHLGFCRMDIHIHIAAGKGQLKNHKGKPVLHQEGLIPFFYCL